MGVEAWGGMLWMIKLDLKGRLGQLGHGGGKKMG